MNKDSVREDSATALWLLVGQASDLWTNGGPADAVSVIACADPAIVERLQGRDDVRVLEAAAAAEVRETELTRYNVPQANALRAPTGLLALYPGLQALSRVAVRTVDVVNLVESVGLVDAGATLLIDMPGEEYDLLERLRDACGLDRFAEIKVQCGTTALYAGSRTAADVRTLLENEGFAVEMATQDDPDRPFAIARSNPSQHRLALMRKELRELNRNFEDAQRRLDTLSAEKAELASVLVGLKAENEKLAGENSALSEKIEEYKKWTNGLKKTQEELTATGERREEALARAQSERDELVATVKRAEEALALAVKKHEHELREINKTLRSYEDLQSEYEHRERLVSQEMIRAEAQVDLIKDLLFNDKAV